MELVLYDIGNNFFNGKALSTQQSPVSQVGSTTSKATSIKQTGGNHSVYEGANSATGKTEHVGRSIQPETRYKQHGRSNPATKKLDYKVIQKGLSLTDARILEQQQIIKHGLNNLPFNKINSIAPSKWHLHDQLKHCVPNSKY